MSTSQRQLQRQEVFMLRTMLTDLLFETTAEHGEVRYEGIRSHVAMENGKRSAARPSQRCLHFDVVRGLEWSKDPESYAGGSVPTGRAFLAGQVKGDDPD